MSRVPGCLDAGAGWPIFTLPPDEIAVHPAGGVRSPELFLMCDDIDATVQELTERGAAQTVRPANAAIRV
jgi:hypothetical protein